MSFLVGLFSLGMLLGGQSETQSAAAVPAERQSDSVAIIDIGTPIDSITAISVKRRLEEAEKDGADAIVLELNTPGGDVESMLDICRLIKEKQDVITVGWVNHEAYSAGAIIALATDEIVVANGARMGDAAPIAAMPLMGLIEMPTAERAKLEAPLLTEVVDSARRNGYDEKLVQSFIGVNFALWEIESQDGSERRFVDANEYLAIFGKKPPVERLRGDQPRSASTAPTLDQETNDLIESMQEMRDDRSLPDAAEANQWKLSGQVVGAEELLIVDSDDAIRMGLATQRVTSKDGISRYFGAKQTQAYHEHWSEHLARFLMSWPVRIVLVVVMIIAFLIEAAVPGSGIFGGLALIALGLLIGAPLLVGMAQWWEVALILLGLVLIALELLVTPGIGALGLLGVSSLLAGTISLVVTADLDTTEGGDQLVVTIAAVCVSLVAGLSLAWWLSKKTGRIGLFGGLILQDQSGAAVPGIAHHGNDTDENAQDLIGLVIHTETDLRPTGKVRVNTSIHDARSLRGWIPKGASVIVRKKFGGELEVELHESVEDETKSEES